MSRTTGPVNGARETPQHPSRPLALPCDMLRGMLLRERLAFWSQFRADFHGTGAVQPSSRFLARAMADPIAAARAEDPVRPLHILEMGPGTGAVTAGIVSVMGPDDRLDCYEINSHFAEFLQGRVASDPLFETARGRVEVHCRAAQEVPAGLRFDFVVCSVPLNNLEAEIVDAIFNAGFHALHGTGAFTFFEYPVLPSIKAFFAPTAERLRIRGVAGAKARRREDHGSRSSLVLLNVPPARVCHIEARPETSSA